MKEVVSGVPRKFCAESKLIFSTNSQASGNAAITESDGAADVLILIAREVNGNVAATSDSVSIGVLAGGAFTPIGAVSIRNPTLVLRYADHGDIIRRVNAVRVVSDQTFEIQVWSVRYREDVL